MLNPFDATTGPRNAKVIVVGEAWGDHEASARKPFVGPSGKELDKMLFEAGLLRSEILCTNVVDARPAGNDFTEFLISNAQAKAAKLQPENGIFPSATLVAGLRKLDMLISEVKPKLIIGAGNLPLWALTSNSKVSTQKGYRYPGGIMSYRGSQLYTTSKIPFLPIIHPAAILRAWDLRTPTVHDLRSKAAPFLRGEISWQEPQHYMLHKPTFAEAKAILEAWIVRADRGQLKLAHDIETYNRSEIVCMGFADSEMALCIPYFYLDANGGIVNYFTLEEETKLQALINRLLTHPNTYLIGQNYKYDYQFIYRKLGIKPNFKFDTMLAHHVLFPGTPKALHYLASLYATHYVYWKDESEDWATELEHETLWLYNCKDCRYTYDIAVVLDQALTQSKMQEQFTCQLEQWAVTAAMEINGVLIDKDLRNKMNSALIDEYNPIEAFLSAAMPENTRYTDKGEPWFTSPKLTMDIFYRQLGLPVQTNRKTKQPSTDAQSLDALKKKVPWMRAIFSRLETLRSIGVFRSHFLEAKLGADGRMRCSYNIGGTETYRWSSNVNPFDEGTNLQNIPKGDEK